MTPGTDSAEAVENIAHAMRSRRAFLRRSAPAVAAPRVSRGLMPSAPGSAAAGLPETAASSTRQRVPGQQSFRVGSARGYESG